MNNVIEYTSYLIEYFKKYSLTGVVSAQIIVIRIGRMIFHLNTI